jgi:hypothetical protein
MYRVIEKSLYTCWKSIIVEGSGELVGVGGGVLGVRDVTSQVRHLRRDHFPLPTQNRYRFTTVLAGAQRFFTHPVVSLLLFGFLLIRLQLLRIDI